MTLRDVDTHRGDLARLASSDRMRRYSPAGSRRAPLSRPHDALRGFGDPSPVRVALSVPLALRPFSGDLVAAKSLEAIIFVGLILPILANNNEQSEELAEQAAAGGLAIATITGGAGVSDVGSDLLDHSARARAVEVGIEDGQQAAQAVMALTSR